MLHEVDEGLRAILTEAFGKGSGVEVVFDAPNKDWAARRSNAPTIDVYLYDIREDLRRRTVGRLENRGPEGLVTSYITNPRFFRLSYLVTAWTQRPEDEHRLLSSVLRCFLRNPVLPPEVVDTGALAGGPPVGLDFALPPAEERSLSDVWSALGGELKPSIDLVVTAAAAFDLDERVAPPVLDEPKVVVKGSDFEEEHQRGGKRRKGADGAELGPAESTARRGGRVVTVRDRSHDED